MHAQLLYNNWFGKAVGATCAWIWAPADPFWLALSVIVGIGLGQLYDSWALEHRDDDAMTLARMAAAQGAAQSGHMEYLFAALGRLAKSDGRVTPEHIAYAERLMRQMNLDRDIERQAQAWFNGGKQQSYPLQQLSRACLTQGEQAAAARLTILRALCGLIAAAPTDANLVCLKQLGGYLGFAPARIARVLGDMRTREHAAAAQSRSSVDADLTAAYKRLGIAPGSSAKAAKSAYRQLVNKHHPDKLGPNASEGARQHAQTHMVALREALELIENRA